MKKLFASFFITLALLSCNSNEPTAEEIQALQSRVRNADSGVLTRIYESRNFRPIWVVQAKPLPRVETLAQTLNQAYTHGLDAADYEISQPQTIDDPAGYEIHLTQALAKFAFDIAGDHKNVEGVLTEAIAQDTLGSIVDELAPKHIEYRNLQRALQTYDVPQENLEQIRWTMNWLRTLPADLGQRYIRVNIPEYRLAVIEDGKETLGMNVVVGKVATPTPVFSDAMTHIIFSPYWNIPESILTNETLPKAVVDANYLTKQNIEIVKVSGKSREIVDPAELDWSDVTKDPHYSFRQKPGVSNALGLVKFMFPNKYDVYLHDTPADNLFKRDERHFSHGCIRVEQPLELAKYLLRDQPKWTEQKINAAMHDGDESSVKLTTPIPVHIMYMTAWTTQDGALHFGKDIYNLQKK